MATSINNLKFSNNQHFSINQRIVLGNNQQFVI